MGVQLTKKQIKTESTPSKILCHAPANGIANPQLLSELSISTGKGE